MHSNDLSRPLRLLDPVNDPAAPEAAKNVSREFITPMHDEITMGNHHEDVDLKHLGLPAGRGDDILTVIARLYGRAE